MTTRLRPSELNGADHDDELEDEPSELLRMVRSIDERLGRSPDHATGCPGTGLCGVVAELKEEKDYRARVAAERAAKWKRWRERAEASAAVVAVLAFIAGAIHWALKHFSIQ